MASPRDQRPVLHTKKHIARLERERRQTRMILAGFIGILVLVVGLLAYGFVDVNYLQGRRPVAEVGGVAISVRDWQARVRMERRNLIGQVQLYQQYQEYLGIDLSAQQTELLSQLGDGIPIGQSVLDDMVDEELIRQETSARGISVPEQEVEQAVQAAFRYYPLGTPTSTISPTVVASPTLSARTLELVTITPIPTEFIAPPETPTATPDPMISPTHEIPASPTTTAGPTATPLPTATPISKESYEESYKTTVQQLTEDGVTEASWRLLVANDILRTQLMDLITADVARSEERVWARHILVPEQPIAFVVRERLEKGEDFAAVAAEVSTDPSNKDRGGDLGWFRKGAMVPEFEAAAFGLPIGELSQPVKTEFGYHIIQVLARGQIALTAEEYESARQTAFELWRTEARSRYNVKTYDRWRGLVPTDPAPPLTGP